MNKTLKAYTEAEKECYEAKNKFWSAEIELRMCCLMIAEKVYKNIFRKHTDQNGVEHTLIPTGYKIQVNKSNIFIMGESHITMPLCWLDMSDEELEEVSKEIKRAELQEEQDKLRKTIEEARKKLEHLEVVK